MLIQPESLAHLRRSLVSTARALARLSSSLLANCCIKPWLWSSACLPDALLARALRRWSAIGRQSCRLFNLQRDAPRCCLGSAFELEEIYARPTARRIGYFSAAMHCCKWTGQLRASSARLSLVPSLWAGLQNAAASTKGKADRADRTRNCANPDRRRHGTINNLGDSGKAFYMECLAWLFSLPFIHLLAPA